VKRCAHENGRQTRRGVQPNNFLFGVPVSTTITTLSTTTPLAAPEETVTVQEAYGETSVRHTGHLPKKLYLVLDETYRGDRDG
jgi:hypothetical protein